MFVPSCSLKHAAAFRVLWVGWKFSDLGREVAWSGFSSLLKCPLLVFLEVKSQPAMASSLLFGGWVRVLLM